MNPFLRRTLVLITLYTAGLVTGVVGTGVFVFQYGAVAGARVIQAGVRLAGAGSEPLWSAAILSEPPEPVVQVAARKGK